MLTAITYGVSKKYVCVIHMVNCFLQFLSKPYILCFLFNIYYFGLSFFFFLLIIFLLSFTLGVSFLFPALFPLSHFFPVFLANVYYLFLCPSFVTSSA